MFCLGANVPLQTLSVVHATHALAAPAAPLNVLMRLRHIPPPRATHAGAPELPLTLRPDCRYSLAQATNPILTRARALVGGVREVSRGDRFRAGLSGLGLIPANAAVMVAQMRAR